MMNFWCSIKLTLIWEFSPINSSWRAIMASSSPVLALYTEMVTNISALLVSIENSNSCCKVAELHEDS